MTKASAAPIHDKDCDEWCNHCSVCGVGILWGSLCHAHERRFGSMEVNLPSTTGGTP